MSVEYHTRDYDAVIVGAGPGGSSIASLLARRGVSCLLLDRAKFPREKVCGDGLTPQALFWLERLGCIDEVLERTDCCMYDCDLHINGRRILTGRFPQTGMYPGFCTLLRRRDLDHILVRNAAARGAHFIGGCAVDSISRENTSVIVEGSTAAGRQRFRTKLLIGADGAGSMVSRLMGNNPAAGTKALSVRAYFSGVRGPGSSVKVFFDDYLFPGYGWIFVDDHGTANVGVGCVSDPLFNRAPKLRPVFERFVSSYAAQFLGRGRQTSPVAGGWAAFSNLDHIAADNVMLVGDAAHHTDPLNGGGIHKAMEDAALAADVAIEALAGGDCSYERLKTYEDRWNARSGADWRSAELLLAFAKNPHLRSVYLAMLERIGSMCESDGRFAEFCAGVFSGVVAQRLYLSPLHLLSVTPLNPQTWLGGEGFWRPALSLGAKSALACLQSGREVMKHPLENLTWSLDTIGKFIDAVLYVPAVSIPDTERLFGYRPEAGPRDTGPAHSHSSFPTGRVYAA